MLNGRKDAESRGLKFLLPVLRTRKYCPPLPAGRVLVVECTDPLAAIDIPNLLREGRRCTGVSRAAGLTIFPYPQSSRERN